MGVRAITRHPSKPAGRRGVGRFGGTTTNRLEEAEPLLRRLEISLQFTRVTGHASLGATLSGLARGMWDVTQGALRDPGLGRVTPTA
jgi:hypothetical protein